MGFHTCYQPTTAHSRHRLLAHAIEALSPIKLTRPLERLLAGLLLPPYERRYLRRCTEVSPKDGLDE